MSSAQALLDLSWLRYYCKSDYNAPLPRGLVPSRHQHSSYTV